MDEGLKTLLTILGTTGGSAFVLSLVSGIGKWLSGTAHREQLRNTSLAKRVIESDTKRNAAEDDRDDADSKRREAEEHVSILKRQLRELGQEPLERPE